MANRRTRHRPTARTTSLLLILIALLLALLVAAAPASAFDDWKHGGATESTCDSSGCHKDKPASNTACVGCHSGYTTSGSQKCWDCHEPGSAPSVSCSGDCHLFRAGGDHPAYPTSFSHGVTPHLGASGYGKSCVDCHGAGNTHHDAAAAPEPACATCHNGTYAAVPVGHEGRGTMCTACHVGMNRPASDCASCHVGNPSSGGPQVVYSNSPACGDAGCHGKVKNHVGTSIAAAACTTCHTAHYESLGTCTKCHADPQRFHHGTAKATPLADCATCHNGSIAAAPKAHAGFGTKCASCHTGMDRPSGDCASCHATAQGTWPAVVSTNETSCADALCHGKVANHSGALITEAPCTTCHTSHYESLGTCTKCHLHPATFHHGTAKATPLVECSGCHDGRVASAKKAHAGLTCTTCHTGMARPPVPATCHDCHAAATFGALACTTCHSKTGMIGQETAHATDPAATVTCTTCHKAHYESLGACSTCHGSHAETHHGTATLADTQLKLAAKPSKIRAHKKAMLKGTLQAGDTALASQSVLIQARKLKGGSFKKVAVVTTDADGRFSRVVKPRVGTEYRAVWRPSGAYAAQQRPAVVTVKLRVSQ